MTQIGDSENATADVALLKTPLDDVTQAHILGLITSQVEENQKLEYKRSPPDSWPDKEKSELRKDAAAMANGGGGIIIYGIDEDKEGRAESLCSLSDAVELKSRIESILISNIEPPFRRIGIRILDVDEAQILLLRVDNPIDPPHCVFMGEWNRRYPIRQGRDTRPMSHGEIREAMRSDQVLREISQIRGLIEQGGVIGRVDPTAVLTSREILSITDSELFAKASLEEFSRNSIGRPYLRIAGIPNPLGEESILRSNEDELRSLLSSPPGARRQGWYLSGDNDIKRLPVGLSVIDKYTETALSFYWNGAVVFDTPLDTTGATWAYKELAEEGETILNPRCFVEPIVCVLALLKKISGMLPSIIDFRFAVDFVHAQGITVTPCSIRSPAMMFRHGSVDSNAFATIDQDRVQTFTSPFKPSEITEELANQVIVELFAELNINIRSQNIPIEDEIFEVLRASDTT
ncbi:MAG: putative DNA binding domain-containing protein [Planctomycetota bacterium]|nr:putative DNA binding domain-containing protein [Planctomycetota bacterium]